MTAVFYPDRTATSDGGRYTLEACSPDNGTIPYRDGPKPTDGTMPRRQGPFQRGFRYQLLDNRPTEPAPDGGRRVVWERWQNNGEHSPHELVVSEEGWAVIRTHGSFISPEVIVVAPDGHDLARVLVVAAGEAPVADPDRTSSAFVWPLAHLHHTTAGDLWSSHSWPCFFRHAGAPYFSWRASWGQRLVIDLTRGTVHADHTVPTELIAAAAAEEQRGASSLLSSLSGRMDEVRGLLARRADRDDNVELWGRIWQADAAIHLAGVHRIRACVPFLREWEDTDAESQSTGSVSMPGWYLGTGWFRPQAQHALKLLGEVPRGLPAYGFVSSVSDERHPMAEAVADRAERALRVTREMTAGEVLQLLGSPDFIRRQFHRVGERGHWSERWEYDFWSGAGWTTRRLTWEEGDGRGRMVSVEDVSPDWLVNNEREHEYLGL
ncbi:MAG: hypothetical protein U0804_12745 [Gemmataceae bacterium]